MPVISTESIRGALLVLVGHFDELMKEYFLNLALIQYTPREAKELFNLGGPFSSLSAKIKIARACGTLPKELCLMIEAFREARNKAAHETEDFDMEKWWQSIGSKLDCVGKGLSKAIIDGQKGFISHLLSKVRGGDSVFEHGDFASPKVKWTIRLMLLGISLTALIEIMFEAEIARITKARARTGSS